MDLCRNKKTINKGKNDGKKYTKKSKKMGKLSSYLINCKRLRIYTNTIKNLVQIIKGGNNGKRIHKKLDYKNHRNEHKMDALLYGKGNRCNTQRGITGAVVMFGGGIRRGFENKLCTGGKSGNLGKSGFRGNIRKSAGTSETGN